MIALSLGWLDREQGQLSGRAQAVDGDTLRLGGQRIRLTNLDAPELDQTCTGATEVEWSCGQESRSFLAGILRSNGATCTTSGHDHYGRILAACTVEGRDLGAQVVTAGWAVGDFGYAAEEASARAAKRGIWSGGFVTPAEWRRIHDGGAPGFWQWIRSWFQ